MATTGDFEMAIDRGSVDTRPLSCEPTGSKCREVHCLVPKLTGESGWGDSRKRFSLTTEAKHGVGRKAWRAGRDPGQPDP